MTADTGTASRISLLRGNPRFRTFWVGETISQFGDRISELALPLIAVTVLSATPGQVSVLTALIWLPYLLGVFVGAWVDRRTRKRRLLIIADLARAAALVSLPAAYLLDAITLAQLYLVAALTGVGSVLFGLVHQAFFVTLVPPSDYVDATSKLSVSRAASFVAGPAWARIAMLAAIELVSSVGVMLMDVNLNALLTAVTPDDARGRRAGAYSAVNYGMRPLGALAAGWWASTIGLRPTLAIAGLGGTLAVLWLLAPPVRRISDLDGAAARHGNLVR